jgi:putative DNA primase/helicase
MNDNQQDDAGNPTPHGKGQAGEAKVYTVENLAKLSPLEYDKKRMEAAEALNVRVGTLDGEVRRAKQAMDGQSSFIEQTEPWDEPVVVGEVLDEIRAAFNRHAILSKGADVAATLWCAFTWFIDAVAIAPLLIIRSPESECGKTTVKDVLEIFVRRPLSSEGITNAAMFRVVEQEQPTLLLDDADSWLLRDPKDERHSLINSGHKRGGRVFRCVGDKHELKAFSTFSAKVIAFIGKSKDTLHNRSIEIVLRRKMPGESITPLRYADQSNYDPVRAKLARMEVDYLDEIARAQPEVTGLSNRAADNWAPLFAIADLAGGDWPDLARNAQRALQQGREPVVSTGVELLVTIKRIFQEKNLDRISSARLVEMLCQDPEADWSTFYRGQPITQKQIANKLGEYGITPRSVRLGSENTPKGYTLAQFHDAFARYVPPAVGNGVLSATPPQSTNHMAMAVADHSPQNSSATPSATLEPASDNGCGGVADRQAGLEGASASTENTILTPSHWRI